MRWHSEIRHRFLPNRLLLGRVNPRIGDEKDKQQPAIVLLQTGGKESGKSSRQIRIK